MGRHREITVILLLAAIVGVSRSATQYYGSKIGTFKTFVHGVVGDLFAVDHKTIYIKGFSYDGEGPDAFFWAGTTHKPDTSGFIIPDEKGSKEPLKAYRNKNILIRLPSGKTLRDIKWLSVWCRKFSANFAEIFIPGDLHIPRPVEIGKIPTLEHGVSSKSVMVIDAQTLLVPDFKYDGKGPAAYWWASRGARQHPRGLRLADENGSFAPLPRYTGKTVVITFPDSKTIYDYDWFGVWCEEAQVNFGSVQLPQNILVPPSPRMLGIELEYKLNCEILYDDLGFEVRWIMDGEDVVMQLVAKLEPNEYMSFGLSKNDTKSEMVDADVIVAWVGKNGKGNAVDYFLGGKEQCVGRRGSCPDTRYPNGQNSVTLLNTATVNDYTMITFKRPQVGNDKYDQHVYSDGPQAIVWAIGPLNDRDEVSYHSIRSEGDVFIDFARPPQWNCPQPADVTSTPRSTTTTTTTTVRPITRKPVPQVRGRKPSTPTSDNKKKLVSGRSRTSVSGREPDFRTSASTLGSVWHIPPITCPSDRTFRAQIGPAGGKKGYQAKTGHVGWGIAWYVNGLLIPEITVQRGKTYTFIVEGGNNSQNSARHHPFYISDDPEGGFEHKSLADKRRIRIFAGVTRDRTGSYTPTAAGRMCEWKLPKSDDASPDDFETFDEFQQRLELRCEGGREGKMRWRPDKNTPDVVYYQCYNHRYLGWKINVVDSCEENLDSDAEASIRHEKNITYNTLLSDASLSDLRRGSTKQKIQNLQEGRRAILPEFRANDGIPLVLTEPDIQRGLGTDEFKDISKKVQTTSQIKTALLEEPRNRYSTEASVLFVKDVGQKFQGDNIQKSFQQEGIRASNPRPFKINGDSWTGITLNKTHIVRHPTNTQKVVSRERTPWWKPIAHHPPATASVNRHKAIQTLRTQLSVIRNGKQSPTDLPLHSAAPSIITQQNTGYQEKRFIPVVIKQSSSKKATNRVPVVIRKVVKNISSKNSDLPNPYHDNAPSGTNRGREQLSASAVPRPNVASGLAPIRRTTGQSTRNFVNVALSNLPISQTTVRRKTSTAQRGNSGNLFLPVVISSAPNYNKTLVTNERFIEQKASPTSQLIPVVVPESTGDDAYVLYHVLPLLKRQFEKQGSRL